MKLLALLAFALLLAGCVGGPPAAVGDQVSLRVDSYDAETGALLRLGENRTFELLSGRSGLGLDFERTLIGLQEGDSTSLELPGTPQASFDAQAPRTLAREYGPNPLVDQYSTAQVQEFLGHPPVVGQEFAAGTARFRIESVQGGSTFMRNLLEDGQRDLYSHGGMYIVFLVEGDAFTQRLDPVVGTVFVQSASAPAFPGLAPGAYVVLGMTETEIQLGYAANPGPLPQGIGHASVRLDITVEHVVKAAIPEGAMGDNLVVGGSPQLLGRPTLAPAA